MHAYGKINHALKNALFQIGQYNVNFSFHIFIRPNFDWISFTFAPAGNDLSVIIHVIKVCFFIPNVIFVCLFCAELHTQSDLFSRFIFFMTNLNNMKLCLVS